MFYIFISFFLKLTSMLYSVLYYYGLDVSGTAGCKPVCPVGIIKFSFTLITQIKTQISIKRLFHQTLNKTAMVIHP